MGGQHPEPAAARPERKTGTATTRIRAGGLAAGLWAGLVAVAAIAEPRLEHIGTFVWDRPEPYFGGWSAIEVSDGGAGFIAIGDNAQVYRGRFQREDGVVTGVDTVPVGALEGSDGIAYFRQDEANLADSEGLALLADGGFAVSFERVPRVMIYREGALPVRVELPREARSTGKNGGVEALAVDGEGRLIAIPETAPRGSRGFPVWRQAATGWETLGVIQKSQGFAPVGADIGPEGTLYLLERAFRGVGFQSRVRIFDPDHFAAEGRVLWTARTLQHDNLEGLSVWSRGAETVLTMISDDNYNWFQRTEIVEYRLTE